MNQETNQTLADFSEAAYTQKSMPGYLIDTELSGPDATVYRNNNSAIVAFSGTRPTSKENASRDITTDLGLWAGQKSHLNRFKNALDLSNRVVAKYGKDNVTVTGHSLGGSQAIYVNQQLGIKGSAYNPYFDTQDVLKRGKHFVNDNFNIHTILGDPVSLGAINLMGQSNVHIHTPMSQYANIVKPFLQYNPLVEIPYIGEAVAAAGAIDTGKKILKLHDIKNFTGEGVYASKLTSSEQVIPVSKTIQPEPQEKTSKPEEMEVVKQTNKNPFPVPISNVLQVKPKHSKHKKKRKPKL